MGIPKLVVQMSFLFVKNGLQPTTTAKLPWQIGCRSTAALLANRKLCARMSLMMLYVIPGLLMDSVKVHMRRGCLRTVRSPVELAN